MVCQFLMMAVTLFVDSYRHKKVKVIFDVIMTMLSLILAILFVITLIDTIIE